MKIGIIGLPNVGKSTLFQALTKKQVDIQNYPFCTIDPNVGVVAVPDERLEILSKISKSKKTIPAVIEFFDIAGLVKGAYQGEGLGNKFLSHVRETDVLVHVVRVFSAEGGSAFGGEVTHIYGDVNPVRDIEIINTELIFADLETVKKHLEKIEKDVKRGDKKAVLEKENLIKIEKMLLNGKSASMSLLHLLSAKPMIYLFNKKAGGKNFDISEKLSNTRCLTVDVNFELEMQLLSPQEAEEYRKSSGLKENENLNELIKLSYQTLNLITFFTTGEDETRAWSIKNGSTAPQAGRAIHSDFEEKFIKAEVISYEDFIKKGMSRTQGKDYIVKDGDIIEFKI